MDEIRSTYRAWLRDAHAMEKEALTMMQGMLPQLEDYPDLRARISDHISETKGHEQALATLLEKEGGESMLKSLMARVAGSTQALSGLFTSDDVIKGSLASFAFENMEIASYRVLIATARLVGDHEAVAVFERNLAEEQAMADWLAANLDKTTQAFLGRLGGNPV